MVYYRRKIILALIQIFGGSLEKISFQKLLFLYSKKKKNAEYDFIPYKYGCYSYSANADVNTMIKKEILSENEKYYYKNDKTDFIKSLQKCDQTYLTEVHKTYGSMSSMELIKHTYINFPYYAIKSKIAQNTLSNNLYQRVINAQPNENATVLFTIGYQGISLENFLGNLVKNNIKLLIDVRKNPLSMKYGFSKKLLTKFCNSLDIEYVHIPEVGIESNKRRKLENQSDYDQLFEDYEATTLQESRASQNKILDYLKQHSRVALTCFESDISQCHRLSLSKSLNKMCKELVVKHI